MSLSSLGISIYTRRLSQTLHTRDPNRGHSFSHQQNRDGKSRVSSHSGVCLLETLALVVISCLKSNFTQHEGQVGRNTFASFTEALPEPCSMAGTWWILSNYVLNEWTCIHLPDGILPARSGVISPIFSPTYKMTQPLPSGSH